MQKEFLLKILAVELLIVAFVRFQVMGIEKEREKEEVTEEDKDELSSPQENKKTSIDVYEVITKGKDFVGSIKPYLNKRDQYYVDIFSKIAEIIEIQKKLMSLSEEEIEVAEKVEVDKIGILKAIKPYITEDKKIVIDKFLKFHEALKNLQEKMEKYSKEEDKDNIFDKIIDIYEALRPIIPEEKLEETDKLAKNIKLLEVLNKAEGIMNSMKEEKKQLQSSTRSMEEEEQKAEENKEEIERIEDKGEISKIEEGDKILDTNKKETEEQLEKEENNSLPQGLSDQQVAIIDNLKSMLTKEQQQYMYNMINYLKQQGLVKSEGKGE
ncbi:hypothetical protein SAMN04244560_02913 [Thermoanaerobacter thermohydrosulfuricus]|uniref:Uncharacterized protein n=2 Tax=Thermoanaerobacter thermohydrosulfuricus TaxID=1516 RepID=M8CTX2_THETY|nr:MULTISPECIES: hypothetical protein [Thermoanaerobacter]EMT37884.1 hypothetical protein TthWC1_2663 [Thermoanaerobacter thermohydrosulfuricus WC1]UZQ83572.1 hypothetical protein OEI98_000653 [Thermoanaerobacter sp. RKWS2]SDG78859.1 hypothetical protein SAMN04244560_02913 [Thermoanaerobacter thermohydrosulfuricus]